jgi:uncharacterized protein YijF (DUF1287 family)
MVYRLVILTALALLICRPQFVFAGPAEQGYFQALVQAAWQRTTLPVRYDGSYRRLSYPMGDPPDTIGVCSDVVIRAYRKVGLDLQQAVHRDMRRHFAAYPKLWGLRRTDRNIDHRRVPNLRVFLTRMGASRRLSRNPADYRPGDLVTWNLRRDGGSLPHIGIVVDRRSADGRRPLIIHNIGQGPMAEDMLFDYPITGHYRYRPKP